MLIFSSDMQVSLVGKTNIPNVLHGQYGTQSLLACVSWILIVNVCYPESSYV